MGLRYGGMGIPVSPWDRGAGDKRTKGINGTLGMSISVTPWDVTRGQEDNRDKWDQGNEHLSDPMGQGTRERGDKRTREINGIRGISIHMTPRDRGPGDKWDTKTRGTNGTGGMSI